MSRIYFHVLESVCPDNNTKNIFIGRLVRSLSLYVSTPPQGEKLLDDFSLSHPPPPFYLKHYIS